MAQQTFEFMPNRSLVQKITTGSTALIVCAFLVALVANYWHALAQAKIDHQRQLDRQLNLLSQSLGIPLWSLDDNSVNLIGDAYMTGSDAASLKIFSSHDKQILYSQEQEPSAKVIYGRKDIVHEGQIIGHVNVGLSGASYAASLTRLLVFSIVLGSFIVLSLALFMRILFKKHLEVPLESLGIWTDRVASGDYGGTPPTINLVELSSVAVKFSNMSQKIQDRERSLLTSERKFRGLFENTEVSIWNEDVSEVLSALEALRQEGIKDLRQHLDENPQTAWDMAGKVKVVQVNGATLRLFGARNHDDMLTNIDKTFGTDTIKVFIDELCAIWDREKSFRAETVYRTLDGRELNAIVSFHIPETPEGFKSLPVSIFDITELKRAEKELVKYRDHLEVLVEEKAWELEEAQAVLLQRERLVTLGELTATVSHELRNPLGTIQAALFSFSDSLKNNDPQRALRSIELAERSINRCVNIIEELNSYARVKGLEIAETAVDDWLEEVLAEQTFPAEIRLESNFACSARAAFDQEKLRQVVVNLVTNSVHALQDKESVEKLLQVSTRLLVGEFEIQVRDNGIGMSEKTQQKVFDPLFSTKGFGVGLGMVIVKNIVEQHRGRIAVESREGEGTTITLRLPTHS